MAFEPAGGAPEPSDDGIIHDEYTDPSLENVHELDALDVPGALRDERLLADVADTGGDGIEEIDLIPVSGEGMDTIDTGARRRMIDEADMGLGAEPRSAEEMEDAAIGHGLRGRGAVTRDDELHGELLLDSPDDLDEDEEDDMPADHETGEGGTDDRFTQGR